MPYSTAAEAKDKDLSRLVAKAGWVDSDVEDRIAEGDAVIDGYLVNMGYVLPFASIPKLINRLSILYARYAALRDMYHHFSPSQPGGKGYEGYKEQFDSIMEALLKGDLTLVDSSGAAIEPTLESTNMRVQINTDGVKRALTMKDPESEHLDGAGYSDPSVTGDPE